MLGPSGSQRAASQTPAAAKNGTQGKGQGCFKCGKTGKLKACNTGLDSNCSSKTILHHYGNSPSVCTHASITHSRPPAGHWARDCTVPPSEQLPQSFDAVENQAPSSVYDSFLSLSACALAYDSASSVSGTSQTMSKLAAFQLYLCVPDRSWLMLQRATSVRGCQEGSLKAQAQIEDQIC